MAKLIELKGISKSYDGEKVIDSMNLYIRDGEFITLLGPSGCGKTTILRLILGLVNKTEGELKLQVDNFGELCVSPATRRFCSYVPQENAVFSGTVAENLRIVNPNATDDELKEALKIADALEFIEKLPKKYNAHIAQGGTNVSGGQKQRLSIARAICKNPDVFIFDDSFSALDMKTDAKLRESLHPIIQDMVVMVVAQRVSTIKNADHIVVLDSGKVVGKGRHQELLKKCKVYQGIVKSQLSEKEFAREMKEANA